MKIEMVNISELRDAGYNPRRISKLKQSIKKFGFVDPIIVNQHPERKNIIIGGHQRVKAAMELGIDKVPVVYVDLAEEREKLLNMALNRISGEWDDEKLYNIINELKDKNDILLSGFDDYEIKKILDSVESNTNIKEFDENLLTNNKCPKCGYKW